MVKNLVDGIFFHLIIIFLVSVFLSFSTPVSRSFLSPRMVVASELLSVLFSVTYLSSFSFSLSYLPVKDVLNVDLFGFCPYLTLPVQVPYSFLSQFSVSVQELCPIAIYFRRNGLYFLWQTCCHRPCLLHTVLHLPVRVYVDAPCQSFVRP